jgi:hypothetical protein
MMTLISDKGINVQVEAIKAVTKLIQTGRRESERAGERESGRDGEIEREAEKKRRGGRRGGEEETRRQGAKVEERGERRERTESVCHCLLITCI